MSTPLVIPSKVPMMMIHNAHAQPNTVDPESIVPLPDKLDMEIPSTPLTRPTRIADAIFTRDVERVGGRSLDPSGHCRELVLNA
jgi:hypothetical protein